MNIFVLNYNPVDAARDQCDRHIVKMPLETAQLLCSVYPERVVKADVDEVISPPYKRTHYNHPCAVWARASLGNFEWLLDHGDALCAEYTRRYGRVHKSQAVIEWCRAAHADIDLEWSSLEGTPHPLCMPNRYKVPGRAVESYRRYYLGAKVHFARWDHTREPGWWRFGIHNNVVCTSS